MGTKAYAALLSIARGGIYGHAAMLLMGEGALADLVLSAPSSTYNKADRIANARGETVNPSYSGRRGRSVGQPSWEDRAASVLLRFLIGYGEADLKFRRVEKITRKGRTERGFQVFRVYGGVEAPVGELWIGKTVASFDVSKEELRRFVEEAKRTAPDLSGIKKIRQALEWFATDVSFTGKLIEAGTVHLWQAAWYIALFGEPTKLTSSGADVTKDGIKPNVTMLWRREALDRIIAEEGKELEPLLGPVSKQGGVSREAEGPVKSWRELVDAIDWRWVLERVEELADELKPWIGPESADDAQREGLKRRMLGELALLVHFAETRRGMDDGRWREERAKRLARAVKALSGGRIADEYAERLAKLMISYAESRRRDIMERIYKLAEELVGISKDDVWEIVDFVLSDMYCLARDCADDRIVRKFVAPALELMMLDKARRGEINIEEALLNFGEMYATAVAGDGYVGRRKVGLAVGGELGGGAALLRLATLHLLKELLPEELKFGVRVYMGEGVYRMATSGEDAAWLRRLLAVSAPSASGEYLSPKFDEFMKEARVEVRVDNISDASSGIAADLIISVDNISIKYNVYLTDDIMLEFRSTDRSRVELAARLLKHAGVTAEVRKEGGRDVWYVRVYTNKLAAGREELRKALIEIVKEAMKRNAVNTNTAERWLEKLEKGRVLMEGWPEYGVGLVTGALLVRFGSPNPDSIQREAQRFREMGLVEGVHFSVKMPGEGRDGYVYIRREGLAYAAFLSVHGSGRQQELAAAFVELILRRAKEADGGGGGECGEVCKKAEEIIEKGKAWGSLKLEDLKDSEIVVEVNGRRYVVKVKGGKAAVEESQHGKLLLRIKITAEVGYVKDGQIEDRVEREYTITYSRYGKDNVTMGRAYANADAPGGKEAEAEMYSALIEVLTGKKPTIQRMKGGKIMIVCGREHLDGFMRYIELVDAIMKWLVETSRR
jgi:hypothetical protein